MRLVWARVDSSASPRRDIQRLEVTFADGRTGVALCYPRLSGECGAGDDVLLNTTAVDLELGTGGQHFVVARAPERRGSATAVDSPSGGHIMKLRYTPLQVDVLAAEAPEGPGHEALLEADDVGGMVAVCCALHSQIPLVAAGVKEVAPEAKVAYLMTDEAALPMAYSDLVAACTGAALLDTTVSCGQSFGGELESVNLHSGLLVARHLARADVAIVSIGPGVAGTATALGHGGVAQGEAINAVGAVGGRAVAALRVSFADSRERHRGVSHHTLTALTRIALASAVVAVPSLGGEEQRRLEADLERAGVWDRHEKDAAPGAPLPDTRGVSVTTMGRGVDDDPAFFGAAAAAGRVAGRICADGA